MKSQSEIIKNKSIDIWVQHRHYSWVPIIYEKEVERSARAIVRRILADGRLVVGVKHNKKRNLR